MFHSTARQKALHNFGTNMKESWNQPRNNSQGKAEHLTRGGSNTFFAYSDSTKIFCFFFKHIRVRGKNLSREEAEKTSPYLKAGESRETQTLLCGKPEKFLPGECKMQESLFIVKQTLIVTDRRGITGQKCLQCYWGSICSIFSPDGCSATLWRAGLEIYC